MVSLIQLTNKSCFYFNAFIFNGRCYIAYNRLRESCANNCVRLGSFARYIKKQKESLMYMAREGAFRVKWEQDLKEKNFIAFPACLCIKKIVSLIISITFIYSSNLTSTRSSQRVQKERKKKILHLAGA